MKASDVHIGSCYRAVVSGRMCDIRVDAITDRWDARSSSTRTRYQVTNLRTGRRLVFRSAQRFRSVS